MTFIEARERLAPDQLTLPTPETESLSEDSILKLEKVKCPKIGMAGAVAHWGRKYEREEVNTIIAKKFGEDKIAEGTGFGELYRVPENYTFKQIFAEEIMMVQRLVGSALELNGWKPEEVDALYFGGTPPFPYEYGYGAVIARATGLTHLDPKENIRNYYLACNAGGRALKEALTNPRLRGKNVLVTAVEGLTRQMRGFDPEKADPLSLQFFSDGAAAIGVVPGKTSTYLLGESKAVEDKGALAAVAPWKDLIDPKGDLIQVVGNITLIQLPSPPEGKQIQMHGRPTAGLFLKNVTPVVGSVDKQHGEQYPEEDIKMAIPHHASAGVNALIGRKLEKMGIKIPMYWVVEDGNSSGATTLIAFVRLMENFNPGDHVMVVSFGAGISIDVFVVEIGGREVFNLA